MATGMAAEVRNDAKDTASISSRPEFRITTSLRWRSSVSLTEDSPDNTSISFHQSRLLASAEAFGLDTASALLSGSSGRKSLIDSIDKHMSVVAKPNEMYKLTLLVSPAGEITVAQSPVTQPLYDFSFPDPFKSTDDGMQAKVYISPQPTYASPFTLHKTNHRSMYASARSAVNIEQEAPTSAEVLLHNEQGQITEASLSTVYFFRNGSWITPAASCGGNLGATRALALSRGWCTEGVIELQAVLPDEVIILSNGVRGFWPARVASPGLS